MVIQPILWSVLCLLVVVYIAVLVLGWFFIYTRLGSWCFGRIERWWEGVALRRAAAKAERQEYYNRGLAGGPLRPDKEA